MSGGQKRRLDIVMGLIHEPTLVFLDEPTTGLDPQARANLWEHIRGLRDRRGATVFLTTHYLDEADVLADRILIIDQGRIVAADTADNLKAQVAGDLVDLEVIDPAQVAEAAAKLATLTETGADVHGRATATCAAGCPGPGGSSRACIRDLDRSGIDLDSIEVHRPTLDDVFLTLTGRSLRDAEHAEHAQHADAAGDASPGDGPPRPPPTHPREPCDEVPARELHRLPPAAADEPAQPGLGHHRRCCSRCSTCCCSARCSSRWSASSAPPTPTPSSCPGMLVQLGHLRRVLRRLHA